MRKLMERRLSKAFTLIELMIVVVIVAILALVAIPLYTGNVEAARFSEGVAGVGSIRTSMRVYAAGHSGLYPVAVDGADGTGLSDIGVNPGDLVGKYFTATDYVVAVPAGGATYTVTVTDSISAKTYIVNELGVESGTYLTGQ